MLKFNFTVVASSLLLAVVYSMPQGMPFFGWPEQQQINYQPPQLPRYIPSESIAVPKPQPFKPASVNVPQSKLGTGRHLVQPATLGKASSGNIF